MTSLFNTVWTMNVNLTDVSRELVSTFRNVTGHTSEQHYSGRRAPASPNCREINTHPFEYILWNSQNSSAAPIQRTWASSLSPQRERCSTSTSLLHHRLPSLDPEQGFLFLPFFFPWRSSVQAVVSVQHFLCSQASEQTSQFQRNLAESCGLQQY